MSALSDPENVDLRVVEDETGAADTGMTEEEAYDFLTRRGVIAAAPPPRMAVVADTTEDPGDDADEDEPDDDDDSDVDVADEQTGAMVALVPTDLDIQRITLAGGEAPDELHLTLWYLGEALDYSPAAQQTIVETVQAACIGQTAVTANAFGAAMWNPMGDTPAVVLNVGGPGPGNVRDELGEALEDVWAATLPEQHDPWSPHVCLAYTSDTGTLVQAIGLCGPITFDKVRVAFAGTVTDVPLYNATVVQVSASADVRLVDLAPTVPATTGEAGPPAMESTLAFVGDAVTPPPELNLAGMSPTGWYGVICVEGTESGDGRVFSPGVLTWADPPLPFMWQAETQQGHDGAVLVGNIQQIVRSAPYIWAMGEFDVLSPEGQQAWRLNSQGFLSGVSVDVDSIKDADVELVFPSNDGAAMDDGFADLFGPPPDQTIFHAGRIRGATLCNIPAFVEASIKPASEYTFAEPEDDASEYDDMLI